MLDNKHLSLLVIEGLRLLAYEEQVKIFDRNCGGCPFATYRTNVKNKLVQHSNLEEAIEVVNFTEDDYARIIRGCSFGDENFSLFEIVTNTCRLWNKRTTESFEGIFEEINLTEKEINERAYL